MSALTRDDVLKIGELARLKLSSEETQLFTAELGAILDYVKKLNEVDTSGIEPMSHCSAAEGQGEQRWRDDVVQPSLGQKAALENAPDPNGGYFRVPKVIGG